MCLSVCLYLDICVLSLCMYVCEGSCLCGNLWRTGVDIFPSHFSTLFYKTLVWFLKPGAHRFSKTRSPISPLGSAFFSQAPPPVAGFAGVGCGVHSLSTEWSAQPLIHSFTSVANQTQSLQIFFFLLSRIPKSCWWVWSTCLCYCCLPSPDCPKL